MGGFFLDSLISSIVKNVRREARLSRAAEWPTADARISRFSADEKGGDIVFSYEINGETEYGSARLYPASNNELDAAISAVNALQALRVRYDPGDPGSSCLLNRDNPEFPFGINQDPL